MKQHDDLDDARGVFIGIVEALAIWAACIALVAWAYSEGWLK